MNHQMIGLCTLIYILMSFHSPLGYSRDHNSMAAADNSRWSSMVLISGGEVLEHLAGIEAAISDELEHEQIAPWIALRPVQVNSLAELISLSEHSDELYAVGYDNQQQLLAWRVAVNDELLAAAQADVVDDDELQQLGSYFLPSIWAGAALSSPGSGVLSLAYSRLKWAAIGLIVGFYALDYLKNSNFAWLARLNRQFNSWLMWDHGLLHSLPKEAETVAELRTYTDNLNPNPRHEKSHLAYLQEREPSAVESLWLHAAKERQRLFDKDQNVERWQANHRRATKRHHLFMDLLTTHYQDHGQIAQYLARHQGTFVADFVAGVIQLESHEPSADLPDYVAVFIREKNALMQAAHVDFKQAMKHDDFEIKTWIDSWHQKFRFQMVERILFYQVLRDQLLKIGKSSSQPSVMEWKNVQFRALSEVIDYYTSLANDRDSLLSFYGIDSRYIGLLNSLIRDYMYRDMIAHMNSYKHYLARLYGSGKPQSATEPSSHLAQLEELKHYLQRELAQLQVSVLKLEEYARAASNKRPIKEQLKDEVSTWSTREQEEKWLRAVSPVYVVHQKINVLTDVMRTLNLLPQTSDVQAKKSLLIQHIADLRHILTKRLSFFGLSPADHGIFQAWLTKTERRHRQYGHNTHQVWDDELKWDIAAFFGASYAQQKNWQSSSSSSRGSAKRNSTTTHGDTIAKILSKWKLSSQPSPQEIRAQHAKFVRLYHPDAVGHDGNVARFYVIQAEYQVLKDRFIHSK